MQKKSTAQSGFTLIELLMTIAIAAVVMGFAVPNFYQAIRNNRITTAANDFVTSVNVARSEAIRRGERITICKSADGATCTAAGDWAQGWLIFNNPDNDTVVDPGESIIKVQGAMDNLISIIGAGTVASRFSYVATGEISNTGTVRACYNNDTISHSGRAVAFVTTGRARTTVYDTNTTANDGCL